MKQALSYAPVIEVPLPLAKPRVPDVTGTLPEAAPAREPQPQVDAEAHEVAKAGEHGAAASAKKDPIEPPMPPLKPAEKPTVIERYCESVGNIAANAQLARQRKEIAEAEEKVEASIAKLEAKTAEYKEWLGKREAFKSRAQSDVVKIYARMPAEAAAAQLIAMPEDVAAAILSKFEPKVASKVLTEMDAVKAAKLSTVMAGAAEIPGPGKPKAATP